VFVTDVAEPNFVAETLAWCNAIREQDGKPPLKRLPKGRRGDPFSCPCAKATGLVIGKNLSENPTYDSLPRGVRRFIHAVDDGLLPQYDLDPGGVNELAYKLREARSLRAAYAAGGLTVPEGSGQTHADMLYYDRSKEIRGTPQAGAGYR
jgi:hypothetical protein